MTMRETRGWMDTLAEWIEDYESDEAVEVRRYLRERAGEAADEVTHRAGIVRDAAARRAQNARHRVNAALARFRTALSWVAFLTVCWVPLALIASYVDRAPSPTAAATVAIPIGALIWLGVSRARTTAVLAIAGIPRGLPIWRNRSIPNPLRTAWGVLFMLAAAEVFYALYLSVVPVWEDPQWIPILGVASLFMGLLGLGMVTLGVKGFFGKLLAALMAIAMIVTVAITLSFFLGGPEAAAKKIGEAWPKDEPAAIAVVSGTPDGGTVTTVRVPGTWDINQNVPYHWDWRWVGSDPSIRAHFQDGTSASLTELLEPKVGIVTFTGPPGSTVTIRVGPDL